MMPGMTMRKGMLTLMAAAKIVPRWPSARLRAASARWVMNWLSPQ